MAHRFIILSQARCGSELLASLINGHPQATCHAELFSHVTGHPERFNSFLKELPDGLDLNSPTVLSLLAKSYLDMVFRDDTVLQVGFKLLVEQLDNHPYLAEHLFGKGTEPIKIIRLIRRNELKVLLSHEGAKQRNLWHTTRSVARVPVRLPRGNALLYGLRSIRRANHRIRNMFPDHPGMTVAYEDLQHDKQGTISRLQEFLGIPVTPVQSPLHKITPDSLTAAIANYDQVAKTLSESDFVHCLNSGTIKQDVHP